MFTSPLLAGLGILVVSAIAVWALGVAALALASRKSVEIVE